MAPVIATLLLLASSGCAAFHSLTPTCEATIARDALVSQADAISSATGGEAPVLHVPDCDDRTSATIAYPGIPKEEVAARFSSLPFCTRHSQINILKEKNTWWECYVSGTIAKVFDDTDTYPVTLWMVAGY
jgi:hypothetical protein